MIDFSKKMAEGYLQGLRFVLENFDNIQEMQKLKAETTGCIGESVFDMLAKKYLNKDYNIISNIVLPAINGTTQIDQIIVSKFGIFVVEIKTYKGWIWGNPTQEKWTQTLYNEKNTFQNPLRQNYKHIKALQSVLKLPDSKFKSLIVFSGEAQFKTKMPDNVVRGGEAYINYILKNKAVIICNNEVEEIVKKICDSHLSNEEHESHIKKIKEQYTKADKSNPPSCPKCGSKMVLRKSKKGYYEGKEFWGCANYPDCKAVINIEINRKKLIEQKIKQIEKIFNL